MNAHGLQQGTHRGLWFEEDVQLLDLYGGSCEWRSNRLALTLNLKPVDLERDMREVIDANWERVRQARLNKPLRSVDDVPWEIHDIEDPVAREAATTAYRKNCVG